MTATDAITSLSSRTALLAYCYRLVSDQDAAEDLAQEALLVALHQAEAGKVVADWSTWLKGIARLLARVHLRQSRVLPLLTEADIENDSDDPLDALIDAERGLLLDRALAFLEPEARTLLAARYLDAIPIAELALRYDIAENALHARLHRARQGLQQILRTRLSTDAQAHGLLPTNISCGGIKTTLFCPRCGIRPLLGILTDTDFALRCPVCDAPHGPLAGLGARTALLPSARVLAGARGFRVAQRRTNAWWQSFLVDAQNSRIARCPQCMATTTVVNQHPRGMTGLALLCRHCAVPFFIAPTGLLFHSPAGQRFWQKHGRIRSQPAQPIRFAERDAVRTSFAAYNSQARLEAIFDAATLQILHIKNIP